MKKGKIKSLEFMREQMFKTVQMICMEKIE